MPVVKRAGAGIKHQPLGVPSQSRNDQPDWGFPRLTSEQHPETGENMIVNAAPTAAIFVRVACNDDDAMFRIARALKAMVGRSQVFFLVEKEVSDTLTLSIEHASWSSLRNRFLMLRFLLRTMMPDKSIIDHEVICWDEELPHLLRKVLDELERLLVSQPRCRIRARCAATGN